MTPGTVPEAQSMRRVHATLLSAGKVGVLPYEDKVRHSSEVSPLVPGDRVQVVDFISDAHICTVEVAWAVGGRGHCCVKGEAAFSRMIKDEELRVAGRSRSVRSVPYDAKADPRSPTFDGRYAGDLGTINLDPASVTQYVPPLGLYMRRPSLKPNTSAPSTPPYNLGGRS
jgi:hypothetical protein